MNGPTAKTALGAASLLLALPATAQISVGKNVQISQARGNAAHYESIAAADPLDPRRLLAASHIYYEDMQGLNDHSSIVYASFDDGKTWQVSLEPRSSEGAGVDPALTYAPDGSAHFVTLGGNTLYRSPDGGRSWEKPIALPPMLLDREYLSADFNKHSPYYGNIYMNATVAPERLVSGPGIRASGFGLYTSRDQGRSYSGPAFQLVYDPQAIAAPSNSVVLSNGTVISLVAVVDRPNSRPPANQRMPQANVTLYAASSEDGGATLGKSSFAGQFWMNKDRSQGAASPVLAVDPGSPAFKDHLYAVWSDFRSGRLEVMLIRSGDGGRSWSFPQVINDDRRPVDPLRGPDAILPAVAVNKEGVVAVVWYDRRESPDNLGWHIRVRVSLDGGETWLASERVSQRSHSFDGSERWTLWGEAGGDGPLWLQLNHFNFLFSPGHTTGLVAAADGVFHPVWVDNRTGVSQLWTAPITVAAKAAPNGGGELAGLEDLSSALTWEVVERSQLRGKGQDRLILKVRLKNTSDRPLNPARLKLRLLNVASETAVPEVVNADNGQRGPGAVWDFSDTIPEEGLASGAAGTPKELVFAMKDLRPFRPGGSNLNTVLNLSAKILGDGSASHVNGVQAEVNR